MCSFGGINVGKANRIGIADLRALLIGKGYENVATLLQSGNVVLDAHCSAAELGATVERALRGHFGKPINVVVRSAEELQRVIAKDPLRSVASNDSKYLVTFLSRPVGPVIAAALGSADFGDERYHIEGSGIYVWSPAGVSGSLVLEALGTMRDHTAVATVRNWNTVRRLADKL